MRTTFLLVLLAASFVVPYLLFSEGGIESLVDSWYGRGTQSDQVATDEDYDVAGYTDYQSSFTTSQLRPKTPVELAPIVTLEEVLNFGITPPWVLGRWPHVTTGLVDNQLFGYRVPLVTGMDEDDVTGSLTYYFGPTQQLVRITLEGDTGDGRQLISWVTSKFGLERQASPEHGVYLYRRMDEDQILGELRVRPETMVRANQPRHRFRISMVINRPPQRKSSFWPG